MKKEECGLRKDFAVRKEYLEPGGGFIRGCEHRHGVPGPRWFLWRQALFQRQPPGARHKMLRSGCTSQRILGKQSRCKKVSGLGRQRASRPAAHAMHSVSRPQIALDLARRCKEARFTRCFPQVAIRLFVVWREIRLVCPDLQGQRGWSQGGGRLEVGALGANSGGGGATREQGERERECS